MAGEIRTACRHESTEPLPHFFHAAAILDEDQRILWANEDYCRRFGAGDHIRGRFCYEVVHGGERPCGRGKASCPVQQARRQNRPIRSVHAHHEPGSDRMQDMLIETFPIADRTSGRAGRVLHVVHPDTGPDGTSDRSSSARYWASSRPTDMLELVTRVATSDTTILLEGETGTGKELLARAIHLLSDRAEGPFVPVDCSSLRETLLESELFGYVKGAFTGACTDRDGLVDSSCGGTLFLDEVGDIPGAVQLKLLRLLESRTFRRVGGTEERTSDFRLICASHPNLREQAERGKLRWDFFYRINAFPIRVPPLRERMEELPALVATLMRRIGRSPSCEITDEALRALRGCSFPGNVRELLHVLERACLLSGGGPIHREHLALVEPRPSPAGLLNESDGIVSLEEIQARYLGWVAARFRGDRRELARLLGISERTLFRRLHAIRDRA